MSGFYFPSDEKKQLQNNLLVAWFFSFGNYLFRKLPDTSSASYGEW